MEESKAPYMGEEMKNVAQESLEEKLTPEEQAQVDKYLVEHPEENKKSAEDMIRAQRKSPEAGEE